MRTTRALSILAFVLAAAPVRAAEEPAQAKPWQEGKKIEETKVVEGLKVRAFGDRVYFAGQPKMESFKAFADKGVKTVINLRSAEEMKSLDEKAEVEKAGMKYVQVPVGKEEPSAEDLKKIMDALDTAKDAPVLLHCASSNRVGYAWASYRGARHGLAVDAAIEEGKQAGMHAPNLIEWSKKAIEKAKAEAAKPAGK